jgi:Family of unknown function (DUF6328)
MCPPRVSRTGVQILFAFLLGGSFTTPFRQADSFVRVVYTVTLHRMLFHLGRKGGLGIFFRGDTLERAVSGNHLCLRRAVGIDGPSFGT